MASMALPPLTEEELQQIATQLADGVPESMICEDFYISRSHLNDVREAINRRGTIVPQEGILGEHKVVAPKALSDEVKKAICRYAKVHNPLNRYTVKVLQRRLLRSFNIRCTFEVIRNCLNESRKGNLPGTSDDETPHKFTSNVSDKKDMTQSAIKLEKARVRCTPSNISVGQETTQPAVKRRNASVKSNLKMRPIQYGIPRTFIDADGHVWHSNQLISEEVGDLGDKFRALKASLDSKIDPNRNKRRRTESASAETHGMLTSSSEDFQRAFDQNKRRKIQPYESNGTVSPKTLLSSTTSPTLSRSPSPYNERDTPQPTTFVNPFLRNDFPRTDDVESCNTNYLELEEFRKRRDVREQSYTEALNNTIDKICRTIPKPDPFEGRASFETNKAKSTRM